MKIASVATTAAVSAAGAAAVLLAATRLWQRTRRAEGSHLMLACRLSQHTHPNGTASMAVRQVLVCNQRDSSHALPQAQVVWMLCPETKPSNRTSPCLQDSSRVKPGLHTTSRPANSVQAHLAQAHKQGAVQGSG